MRNRDDRQKKAHLTEDDDQISLPIDGQRNQSITDGSPKMHRTTSGQLGSMIKEDPTNIFIIDIDNKYPIPLEEVTFEDLTEMNRGAQGKIYPGIIQFTNVRGEIETRRIVLKSMGVPKPQDTQSQPVEQLATSHMETSTEQGILKLMGYIMHQGEKFAVFPYCELFLDKVINALPELKTTNRLLYQSVVLHILTNIACELKLLHNQGYVHRDLKPENIAYYRGLLVLIDLGISKEIGSESQFEGTFGYTHPESSANANFTSQPGNDVYALGQILKILLLETPEVIKSMKDKGHTYEAQINYHSTQTRLLQTAKKEAVRKRIDPQSGILKPTQSPPSLTQLASDRAIDFETILDEIADRMTHPLTNQQPSLDDLISACELLKIQLEAAIEDAGMSSEIMDQVITEFYDSLSHVGPFPEELLSPSARKGEKAQISRSLSFSASLFGSRDSLSQSLLSPGSSPHRKVHPQDSSQIIPPEDQSIDESFTHNDGGKKP